MSSFLMMSTATAAAAAGPVNGSKVPVVGAGIKEFFPPGSFRETTFLGEQLKLPNPKHSCVCKNRIEWVHVQDTSSSFGPLLSFWKDFSVDFGKAIDELFPGSKMALTSFVDKPLPFLGYGWGHVPENLKRDYCYRKHIDMVDPLDFSNYVQSIPPASGGNDAPENQFGAAINAIYDPALRWSPEKDEDGTEVIRIMSLMTNSSAHGINVKGTKKPDGTEWGSIPNLHGGYDVWWSAEYWNYSYGKQHIAELSTNRPYQSWVFDTKTELNFHEYCGPDSQLIVEYVRLGKKMTTGVAFTSEELDTWKDVLKYCDPENFNDYIGMTQDELGAAPHPGVYTSEDRCVNMEYPNQHQMARAWRDNDIHPIIQIIETEPDTPAVDWYRWAYGCPHDKEYKCVEQFYKDIFSEMDVDLRIDTPKMTESLSKWVNSLIDMVNEIWVENCNCESTTTTSTTTITRESTTSTGIITDPAVTTEGPYTTKDPSPSPCIFEPVCDTCDCVTWPNRDVWLANNIDAGSTRLIEGVCGDGCSICDRCTVYN